MGTHALLYLYVDVCVFSPFCVRVCAFYDSLQVPCHWGQLCTPQIHASSQLAMTFQSVGVSQYPTTLRFWAVAEPCLHHLIHKCLLPLDGCLHQFPSGILRTSWWEYSVQVIYTSLSLFYCKTGNVSSIQTLRFKAF